jgi:hypothetical protein
MAIQDDFSIAANGDIRYTGDPHGEIGAGYYTVIEFHRWLGDLMDDAQASGDDILDITNATASERSTDNIITLNAPYNIDDTTAEHLFDGSVIQSGGAEIYDGILVFSAAGMYLEIVQNGALVTPNFWGNGLNADANNGISHRFMLKVRTGGNDIDGRRIIGQTREFGFTYSEFKINGTARGNNVLALTYATDLNNETAAGTVATWTDIDNTTEGYITIDLDNGNGARPYYSQWNAKGNGSRTINNFYERMKWLTRRGSTSTIYPTGTGINGELFRGITHEVALTTPRSGTFNATEAVSWGSGATEGTGRMLAIDSVGTGTKMWIQLLTGVAPSASVTITGATSGATATNSGSPTDRTLSFPFIGQSTGSAIIGAYGVGIESADLTASDKLTDLNGVLQTPPNNVTFTVNGLVGDEDRVLLGPESGGSLQLNQFTLQTALTGVTTSIQVNTSIPTDTPTAAGSTIRVQMNTGIYRRIEYTSFSGDTFTISSTDFTSDPADVGNNVFISYIDKDIVSPDTSASVTWVFSSTRSLFLRVRDGGGALKNNTPIKTFETTTSMGSAGGSATAIRTSDQ